MLRVPNERPHQAKNRRKKRSLRETAALTIAAPSSVEYEELFLLEHDVLVQPKQVRKNRQTRRLSRARHFRCDAQRLSSRHTQKRRWGLLLTKPERAFRGLDDRYVQIHPAIILNLVLILCHGAKINDGVIVLSIKVAAEPIRDHGSFWTEVFIKNILPARDFRDVDGHLRLRRWC
jgi:hypothetical protein